MMGSGETTKLTAKEYTHMQMAQLTMGIGSMISRMGMVLRLGLMELSMKDFTKKERNTGKENSTSPMEACIMVSSQTTKSLDLENTDGMTAKFMKENG